MTTERPAPQAVVITGTSTGIGRACALHLDNLGYRVFAGVRKASDGAALQQGASARLTPLFIDVTDEASITAAQDMVEREMGARGLFSLVNNAGYGLAAPIEYQPIADLRQMLEVNLIGAVAVTKAFIPLLRQGKGRIINIGSISGLSALPFQGGYCATKFALEAISDSLRVELRPWGVSVSVVEPGNIETPIWQKGLEAGDKMLATWPPRAFDLYGPAIAMMRKMAQEPNGIPADEVAKVVARLLRAKHPETRVLVGSDARLLALFERLPTRTRDWLIALQLPKYG